MGSISAIIGVSGDKYVSGADTIRNTKDLPQTREIRTLGGETQNVAQITGVYELKYDLSKGVEAILESRRFTPSESRLLICTFEPEPAFLSVVYDALRLFTRLGAIYPGKKTHYDELINKFQPLTKNDPASRVKRYQIAGESEEELLLELSDNISIALRFLERNNQANSEHHYRLMALFQRIELSIQETHVSTPTHISQAA